MGGAEAAKIAHSLPSLGRPRGRSVTPVVGPEAHRWLGGPAVWTVGRRDCAERADPEGGVLPAERIGRHGRGVMVRAS
eukprot:15452441-Alexandrium_andersonii.AAC.1